MRVIVGGRQTGKTTTLIELCHEADKQGEVAYIVCHSRANAHAIAQKAEEMGKPVRFPISYDEFFDSKSVGSYITKLFVDNVDMLVQYLTGIPVEAITINRLDNDAD